MNKFPIKHLLDGTRKLFVELKDGLGTESNPMKVKQYGNNMEPEQAIYTAGARKYELETIVDAVSIEDGERTEEFETKTKDSNAIIIAVSIDKKPWSLKKRTSVWGGLFSSTGTEEVFFPPAENITGEGLTSIPSTFVPIIRLSSEGIEPPSSLSEAFELCDLTDDQRMFVENESGETATITVRILRIWR